MKFGNGVFENFPVASEIRAFPRSSLVTSFHCIKGSTKHPPTQIVNSMQSARR